MNTPNDLITAAEARRLLNISPWKMSQLLQAGKLRHYSDPLDLRKKLVSRAEVLKLKTPTAEAA
jgi:hypothetical protein